MFTELFTRDLHRLNKEVQAYPDLDSLWASNDQIKNSGGNLALHLTGNLDHFVGKTLGGLDYQRDRDFEFNGKGLTASDLAKRIENTQEMIGKVLPELTESDLEKMYPIEVLGKPMTTHYFILHLYGHLNYHLGQVTYHRRFFSQS